MAKTKNKAEFGDFQTPVLLAQQVCRVVRKRAPRPSTILEPTCGLGGILLAAANVFPEAPVVMGRELSPIYTAALQQSIGVRPDHGRFDVQQGDYFTHNWGAAMAGLPTPLLIIGNPPWVTNAELSVLGSDNKPHRYNFQELKGLDAMTGKSNFDISEWMLLDMLRWLNNSDATIAMLIKTSVARKVLIHAWKNRLNIHEAAIYRIDAKKHFGAAVDACLLVFRTNTVAGPQHKECQVFATLESAKPTATLSYQDGQLIANALYYEQWQHLQLQNEGQYRWRSGIKHDCSKVMELTVLPQAPAGTYKNGFDEIIELENAYVLPMLKTSEVAKGNAGQPQRRMIVTQRTTGEATGAIQVIAPATWAYLQQYGHLLDGRQSAIYKKRPRFSIFGIGDYAFMPWKVAISGLYKHLRFCVVGPHHGQPVVLDDASYFLGCQSEAEARIIAELLNSTVATQFFSAFIFWDAKRSITVDLLQRLDLQLLAQELGRADEFRAVGAQAQVHEHIQGELFV